MATAIEFPGASFDDWVANEPDESPDDICTHRVCHRGKCIYCGYQAYADSGRREDKRGEEDRFYQRQWREAEKRSA